MDEKKYILKTIATKCILIYILVSFALVPIIYMTIIKMSHVETNYLAQAILNLVSYLGLSITFIILLRNYFKDDFFNLKEKLWLKIIIVVALVVLIKLSEQLCAWFYGLFNETINGSNQTSVVNVIKENTLLMAFSTCLFAPIAEEVIFRKCIFSYFDKNIYGILVSTLAFSLIHVFSTLDFIHILPYIFAGALFSTAYALSNRNIYVSILGHVSVNTISFIVICVNM